MSRPVLLIGLALPLLLSACGEMKTVEPERRRGESAPNMGDKPKESLFGPGGMNLFGAGKKQTDEGAAGIGVNAYLWRGSLDTIAFMPISSADPFGGVILTDWYSPPESANERFKVSVFIMDRALRADGIKVSVFKQQRAGNGNWSDVSVDKSTQTDLENAILTRARQLRIQSDSK
jgi:hypothetical protein